MNKVRKVFNLIDEFSKEIKLMAFPLWIIYAIYVADTLPWKDSAPLVAMVAVTIFLGVVLTAFTYLCILLTALSTAWVWDVWDKITYNPSSLFSNIKERVKRATTEE